MSRKDPNIIASILETGVRIESQCDRSSHDHCHGVFRMICGLSLPLLSGTTYVQRNGFPLRGISVGTLQTTEYPGSSSILRHWCRNVDYGLNGPELPVGTCIDKMGSRPTVYAGSTRASQGPRTGLCETPARRPRSGYNDAQLVAMMSEFGCASADQKLPKRLPLDPVLAVWITWVRVLARLGPLSSESGDCAHTDHDFSFVWIGLRPWSDQLVHDNFLQIRKKWRGGGASKCLNPPVEGDVTIR